MIKIDWSENAESDLQFIFDRVKRKTCSDNLARNVINDIYSASVNIQFTEQYQVDENLIEELLLAILKLFTNHLIIPIYGYWKFLIRIKTPLKSGNNTLF